MSDHGGHGGGKPKHKPKAGGAHGAGGHGESSGPSGWQLIIFAIIAVVLLIAFYSGAIGPSIPVNY